MILLICSNQQRGGTESVTETRLWLDFIIVKQPAVKVSYKQIRLLFSIAEGFCPDKSHRVTVSKQKELEKHLFLIFAASNVLLTSTSGCLNRTNKLKQGITLFVRLQ